VVLNADVWFSQPLALHQIVSWLLLFGSIPVAVLGFQLLRQVGKPAGPFENTTRLVEVGLYHYIRHPLYCSLLLLGWGAFFKDISLAGVGLALGMTVFLYLTARADEAEMLLRFGAEYRDYMGRTKRFIPYLF
jgi:protein-S-isoprenylcysteine O-methyltransferase Ste14